MNKPRKIKSCDFTTGYFKIFRFYKHTALLRSSSYEGHSSQSVDDKALNNKPYFDKMACHS